jgi:hypothetical protein
VRAGLAIASRLGIAALAALACGHAAAQLRAFEFRLDNDQFAFIPRNEERWYTSGEFFRAAWDAAPDAADARLAAAWCARVLACDRDARVLRVATLDHRIFTPAFTGTPAPQPFDRPYAASLGVGLATVVAGERSRQTLEFQLGTVGPGALGEPVQNAIHSVLGQPKVEGWVWQVRARPLAQIGWSRLVREPLGSAGTDVVLRTAVQLGTPVTQAAVGAMVRTGRLPGGPTWAGETVGADERPGAYAFAGVEARAVGHDATIDGATYGYASQVSRAPFAGTAFVGASAGTFADWRLELSLAIHSVPFSTPVEGPLYRPQRIGTIGLRWQPRR